MVAAKTKNQTKYSPTVEDTSEKLTIFNSYRTLIDMLNDRGYLEIPNKPEWNDFLEKYNDVSPESTRESLDFISYKPNRSRNQVLGQKDRFLVPIIFVRDQSIAASNISSLTARMKSIIVSNPGDVKNFIIFYQKSITTQSKKILIEFRKEREIESFNIRIELRHIESFQINITKHMVSSPHRILSIAEVSAFLTGTGIDKENLPLLPPSDPMILWHEGKVGDIVEVIRKDFDDDDEPTKTYFVVGTAKSK